jgi:hypothetical protein
VEASIEAGPLFEVSLNQEMEDSTTIISSAIEGGQPPFDYLWNTGDTTRNIAVNRNGRFSLYVSDARNCVAKDSVLIDNYVGIKPWLAYQVRQLKVYPNPAKHAIMLDLPPTAINPEVLVFDLKGKQIGNLMAENNQQQNSCYSTYGLVPGLYQLLVKANGLVFRGKLAVE